MIKFPSVSFLLFILNPHIIIQTKAVLAGVEVVVHVARVAVVLIALASVNLTAMMLVVEATKPRSATVVVVEIGALKVMNPRKWLRS